MRPDVRTTWPKARDCESIANICLDGALLCLQSPDTYHQTACDRLYYYVRQSMPCKNLLIITRVDEVNRPKGDKA